MLELYGHCALIIFCYMTAVFCLALYKKDNSIVDVAWGIGYILITWYSLVKIGLYQPLHMLITVLVTVWGTRLSWHIYLRNKNKPEDPRYAAWRKAWKWVKLRSFFQVFMLQGLILLIIAYPVIFIQSSKNAPLDLFAYLGTGIWVFGLLFESIGDWQLKVFLNNPKNKGKIMQNGLWRYTRHPNYFGESVMWWGIFIICFGLPCGWTTIVSPLLLTYLLVYVSGVPMAEKFFEGNKEFEEYKKKTSAFLPWF